MRELAACLTLVTIASAAQADPSIQFSEVPGSQGRWHQGSAVIPAPVDRVRRWLTDYDHWPQLLSDISSACLEGWTPEGAAIVRFHSRIAQRTIVIRERQTPFGLEYEGGSVHVRVQGRIYLVDLGDGRTRVIMQSSSDVHGALRPFVTDSLKRSREYALMSSNLTSLYRLGRRQHPQLASTSSPRRSTN